MYLQITLISQFTLREKHENITEVKLTGAKESLASKGLEQENHLTARFERSKIDSLINLINGATALVDYTLEYPVLTYMLEHEEKYDLLIIDMYLTDALLG